MIRFINDHDKVTKFLDSYGSLKYNPVVGFKSTAIRFSVAKAKKSTIHLLNQTPNGFNCL